MKLNYKNIFCQAQQFSILEPGDKYQICIICMKQYPNATIR